jgi:vacuolar-type H+-ATPase subunit F/Vma7
MSMPVFIGDEVSALGYRLAGLQTLVPAPGELRATVRRACEDAPLVLIDASLAAHIDVAELDGLLAATDPPVVIVPPVRGAAPLSQIATRLRRQLGVLE